MTIQQKNIVYWVLRLIAAIVMLQTLFFKFTGAPESIYIFSKLGMEPWGRIGTGVLELLASILILMPRTTGIGALMGAGLMLGAIFFHLSKLGVVVQNDHGKLFMLALIVLIPCLLLLYIFRTQPIALLKKLNSK